MDHTQASAESSLLPESSMHSTAGMLRLSSSVPTSQQPPSIYLTNVTCYLSVTPGLGTLWGRDCVLTWPARCLNSVHRVSERANVTTLGVFPVSQTKVILKEGVPRGLFRIMHHLKVLFFLKIQECPFLPSGNTRAGGKP